MIEDDLYELMRVFYEDTRLRLGYMQGWLRRIACLLFIILAMVIVLVILVSKGVSG